MQYLLIGIIGYVVMAIITTLIIRIKNDNKNPHGNEWDGSDTMLVFFVCWAILPVGIFVFPFLHMDITTPLYNLYEKWRHKK